MAVGLNFNFLFWITFNRIYIYMCERIDCIFIGHFIWQIVTFYLCRQVFSAAFYYHYWFFSIFIATFPLSFLLLVDALHFTPSLFRRQSVQFSILLNATPSSREAEIFLKIDRFFQTLLSFWLTFLLCTSRNSLELSHMLSLLFEINRATWIQRSYIAFICYRTFNGA